MRRKIGQKPDGTWAFRLSFTLFVPADYLGFSYGFRPGRNPHRALAALHTGLMTQCVNWVLDADIRKFLEVAS